MWYHLRGQSEVVHPATPSSWWLSLSSFVPRPGLVRAHRACAAAPRSGAPGRGPRALGTDPSPPRAGRPRVGPCHGTVQTGTSTRGLLPKVLREAGKWPAFLPYPACDLAVVVSLGNLKCLCFRLSWRWPLSPAPDWPLRPLPYNPNLSVVGPTLIVWKRVPHKAPCYLHQEFALQDPAELTWQHVDLNRDIPVRNSGEVRSVLWGVRGRSFRWNHHAAVAETPSVRVPARGTEDLRLWGRKGSVNS